MASRIFLVDDHPVVRWGVSSLIESEADLTVAGEAADIERALVGLGETEADLVVLDLTLFDGGGIEGVRQVRTAFPDLPIVIFSLHHERYFAERAMRAGAQGYVMKSEPAGELIKAVRRVLRGELHMSPNLTERLLRRALDGQESLDPAEQLSDRELEVLQLIGQGMGTRAIAEELSLSVKTVESYRANIKRKLVLESATELSLFAFEWVRDTMEVPADETGSDPNANER